MTCKTIAAFLLLTTSLFAGYAQIKQANVETSYRSIIPENKQKLLSNIDLIANQQYAFRSDFRDGDVLSAHFKMEQFRLEIRGWVTDKVFFRFRHRYTSAFEPQSQDKIIKGVDMAYMAFKLGNKEQWELSVGKFCLDWGGIEFDLNPIEIYEYSDIIEMADNFMSGVGIKYLYRPNNYIGFQLYNSRTQTFDEIYGNSTIISQKNITASKAPLGAVLTWRGSLWDGMVSTLWSASMTNEASGIFKRYLALGQQLNLNNITVAYDFKHSNEDLDRTGIISQIIPREETGFILRDTRYWSHWLKIDWEFTHKWHLTFTGYIDYANWEGREDPMKSTNRIRTAYGFIPTVEFYPWDNLNIKFFTAYVGRIYRYSDYAKSRIDLVDYSNGRITAGIITPLKIL
ncbi:MULTISPECIES: porin [unclassified Carboxylicivirga]|uniref:porin n=1 Tax=Carboxylicivirga TaxID=1628153 RepID=UPI003D34301D